MATVIYSGMMEKMHNLPFHLTDDSQTIVFEQDIIQFVCDKNESFYQEFFLTSPNFFLNEVTVQGNTAFLLLAFVNECIDIFDEQVQAQAQAGTTRDMTDSLRYMSHRVYPVVIAVAKIGAKVQFDGMNPGETPAIIFEREIRNTNLQSK